MTEVPIASCHNLRKQYFDIIPAGGNGQEAQAFKKVTQQLVLWRAYQAGCWRGAEPAPVWAEIAMAAHGHNIVGKR